MKKLLFVLVFLTSFFVNSQDLLVVNPSKIQSVSTNKVVDILEFVDSSIVSSDTLTESVDSASYVFDFKNMTCDFFRFGELVSSVSILRFENCDGLIYVDCDDLNILTGGRIITHYILNPEGKKDVPYMIYHFHWEDIGTTYAEVTLTLNKKSLN